MPTTKKKKSKVARAEVCVPLFGTPCSGHLCAHLLTNLLQHLLFSRGQIPHTYDDMLLMHLAESTAAQKALSAPGLPTRRRPGRTTKRRSKVRPPHWQAHFLSLHRTFARPIASADS